MSVACHLGELLGKEVRRITDLGAIHSWTLHRAVFCDGCEVFVKAADDQGDVLAAEAAGLRWLATDRVPEVLAPYLPRAAAHLGPDGIRLLEQVIENIDAVSGLAEPPSRIHGDLWSGNIRWTPDHAILIDHGSHRETDLAMLALFGAPHLDRIRVAYHETHPRGGWCWGTRIRRRVRWDGPGGS
jgi:fructosamine-3-kinase